MKLESWLLEIWYGDRKSGWWLLPLGWLMSGLTALRRWLYRHRWLARTKVAVPVIVVGNITAGGTGKTPLVIWLVQKLSQSGLHVGVLSRGYGGKLDHRQSLPVSANTEPELVGDEAVLIARDTAATVVVGPERVSGARQLEQRGVQVIVCDDGLQHYRLDRDVEIAVIDGARGFGNARLLPAGPLRESPERLQTVSAVVINGEQTDIWPGAINMHVSGSNRVALVNGQTGTLAEMAGSRVHAVAGIGNPDRFFDLLESYQIKIERHPYPDHATYNADDLAFDDDLPILMTEKDAVKCAAFATDQMWSVPVSVHFAPTDEARLCHLISAATGLKLSDEPDA